MPSKREDGKQADGSTRKRRVDQPDREAQVGQGATLEEVLAPSTTLRVQRAIADLDEASPHDVLALQRIAGNRAVTRLLAKGRPSPSHPVLQTKLMVGPVDDAYEQEADQVAEQVMARPTAAGEAEKGSQPVQRQAPEEEELQMQPTPQRQAEEEEELQMKPILQRQVEEEEEEELQMKASQVQRQVEEEEEIQTKRAGSHTATVSENLETAISVARGSGHPVPGIVQRPMERAIGADFSDVRMHTDRKADALSQQLSAKAFTTGKDVFFRAGEYSPGSDRGRELIAHELTHVVQQAGGIQPQHELQETGEVAQVESTREGAVQRKTQDLPLYQKFTHIRYSKSIQGSVDSLVQLIRGYNSIPLQDTNYDSHLSLLRSIQNLAWDVHSRVSNAGFDPKAGRPKGFLFKPGTLRSLGGPFRLHYYRLLNRLTKLAGYRYDKKRYKGAVNKEIEGVEQQKEHGFEINA